VLTGSPGPVDELIPGGAFFLNKEDTPPENNPATCNRTFPGSNMFNAVSRTPPPDFCPNPGVVSGPGIGNKAIYTYNPFIVFIAKINYYYY
jgi:hypothetical protein